MLKGQAGISLVEVMLVMTITGLLGGAIVAGQTQLKSRARFTDSIETAKNDLAKIQNEAVTTVQEGGHGNNGSGLIFFAKRVIFTNGSNQMQVDTLLYNPATNAIEPGAQDLHNVSLPGATYQTTIGSLTSTGNEVLYVRWPTNGTLYTYTPPIGFSDHNFSSYDPYQSVNRSTRDFQFKDASITPHTATLSVNGATETITRVFH